MIFKNNSKNYDDIEQTLMRLKKQYEVSGAKDLESEISLLKLSLTRGSWAKYARDLIKIRKELGDTPEIANIESKFTVTEFDGESPKLHIENDYPVIKEVRDGILNLSIKKTKKELIIRQVIKTILAFANLAFLSKYAESKNESAMSLYGFITILPWIAAIDFIIMDNDSDMRVAVDKYKNDLIELKKLMDEKGIPSSGYSLTKKIRGNM